MRMIRTAITAVALSLCAAIPQASPATASPTAAAHLARIDKSACTHHWSGPQVCIRMRGDALSTPIIGFWSNPPKSVKSRASWLTSDGRRATQTVTARRVGKTISHSWSGSDYRGAKVCVHFSGISRVACMKAPI